MSSYSCSCGNTTVFTTYDYVMTTAMHYMIRTCDTTLNKQQLWAGRVWCNYSTACTSESVPAAYSCRKCVCVCRAIRAWWQVFFIATYTDECDASDIACLEEGPVQHLLRMSASQVTNLCVLHGLLWVMNFRCVQHSALQYSCSATATSSHGLIETD